MFNLSPIDVQNMGNKTVLVTGAGSGIGAETVKFLVDRGAKVYAGVFREINSNATNLLDGATILPLDVTNQQQVNNAMATIKSKSGKLDALVNNAGVISPIGHSLNIDSDDFKLAFEVNVLGIHRMMRAAMPLLLAAKGTIVNAGTGAATTPMEGWSGYCSSKAAARMMTQVIAKELENEDVKFFFLGIPPTDTNMQAAIRSSKLNPVSKIAQSDLVSTQVIASAVAWLCTDSSRDLNELFLDIREAWFANKM